MVIVLYLIILCSVALLDLIQSLGQLYLQVGVLVQDLFQFLAQSGLL